MKDKYISGHKLVDNLYDNTNLNYKDRSSLFRIVGKIYIETTVGNTKVKMFYDYGAPHRYDGPAIQYSKKYNDYWYLFGEAINSFEYCQWLRDNNIDIKNITPEDEELIKMKWKPS